MIYLKNNTEIQAIYIPRQTVLGGGYIPSTKAYDKGYNDGLEVGKEQQKSKLSNLYVTENGQYEREDGWNVVNVDVPDLNGSYSEGYEQGKTDGANEQKSKLESISITENGTYNKEDGYNHIEVNVPSYEEGQADMAAKARVLEVTENGVYRSKFSDSIIPTVTGVYGDGTNFYNYAELNGKVFNTNIPATKDSRIELWWKNDGSYIRLGGIIGAQNKNIFKFVEYSATEYRIEYGNPFSGSLFEHNFTYNMASKWNHIIFSKQDGLNVNGELICEIQGEEWIENAATSNFWINAAYLGEINNNANGTFGMIKINDTIIIPTADGFLNTNTGELLEVVKDGDYTFTKNLPTYGEGEIYKTINVNVPDLNGSYDEGYAEGERAGYEQGQTDIATNARVLNVTENGVYKSKFSDPIIPANYTVTGVYADGTKFYNYAQLGNKAYNTNITVTQDSVIELWYKGDNANTDDGWNTIFTCTKENDDDFYLGYMWSDNTNLTAWIGQKEVQFSWDDNVWHHIIMKNDGLWIDDALIGSFNSTRTFAYKLGLNRMWGIFTRSANGCYGMIKIDDTIIIPTADGFLNTNTGELLEVVHNGDYTFTENLPIYAEGELYKTINVNVPTVQEQSFNYDITAFTYKVYDWTSVNINRDNITNDCGDRPLDCLLFRNRSGECTVMTKLDTCSGTARLENGWSGDNIILSLKSNSITKFSSNSINSNQLTSIDTGFAKLEGNAITNCNALTDIKVTVLNDNLSTQFATNCFNGLPANGTITIGKNVDVTITDDAITSFFRTIVGEGWTITIK